MRSKTRVMCLKLPNLIDRGTELQTAVIRFGIILDLELSEKRQQPNRMEGKAMTAEEAIQKGHRMQLNISHILLLAFCICEIFTERKHISKL